MDLIDKKELIMQKIVAECLAALLEQGSRYSHLMIDFVQYLPQYQKLINETEKGKVKYELIKIAYSLCKNVSFLFITLLFINNILFFRLQLITGMLFANLLKTFWVKF